MIKIKESRTHYCIFPSTGILSTGVEVVLLLLVLELPPLPAGSPASPPPSRGMLWEGVRPEDELWRLCSRDKL